MHVVCPVWKGLAGNKDKQLTPLERKLLCPLLFLFIWPLFKLISLTIRVAKIKKSKEKNDTKVVPVSKKKQLTKAGDSKTATEIKIATETKVRVRNWDLDLTDAQEVVGGNIKTPRKIFQQFDVDGDGSLDRTETHEALKQLGFSKMTDDEFELPIWTRDPNRWNKHLHGKYLLVLMMMWMDHHRSHRCLSIFFHYHRHVGVVSGSCCPTPQGVVHPATD